ncbi:hypothetical protein HPB50_026962 [Hyalomma asiaticum]|uniref:Uncharacterized protein n=1 Tax=Hyalomma asiaticum TaxID=266040 RepID=A0ACB7TRV9_HYAAI|nr:hypothetical protein HPB50_026962 [Hyalomma asiaticum]
MARVSFPTTKTRFDEGDSLKVFGGAAVPAYVKNQLEKGPKFCYEPNSNRPQLLAMANVVLLLAVASAANFDRFSASSSDEVLPSVRYRDYDGPNRRPNAQRDTPEFVKDLYSLQSIPVPGVDYEFLPIPIKLPADYRNSDSENGEDKDATVNSAQKASHKEPQLAAKNDASSEADDRTGEQNEETRDTVKQDRPRKPIFDSSDERHDSSVSRFDDGDVRRGYESYPSKLPPPSSLRSRLGTQYPDASIYPNRQDVEVPRTGFLGISQARLESQPTGSMQGGRRNDERSSKPALEFHFDIPNDKFHSDLAHGRFSTFKEVPSSLDTLVSSDVSFLNKMIADPPVPENLTRDDTERSYNTGGDRTNTVAHVFPSLTQNQPVRPTPSSYQTYPSDGYQGPDRHESSQGSYEDSGSYSQPESRSRRYSSSEREYPYKADASMLKISTKPANGTPRTKRSSKMSQHRETRIAPDFIKKNASYTEAKVSDHGSPILASCAENEEALPFCIVDPSYPRKEIAMALKEDVEFKRIFNHLRAAQKSGGREHDTTRSMAAHCPSSVRPVRPLKGKDVLGEWKTIVNVDGFGQELLLNTCSAESSPCRAKPPKSCVQLFEIRMLALYNERTRKLHSGEFRVPTGCICGDGARL